MRRASEQLRELRPDVDELQSQHGLLAAMLVGVAYDGIITAGVLRPPQRQGLHDCLTYVLVLDGKTGESNHRCPESAAAQDRTIRTFLLASALTGASWLPASNATTAPCKRWRLVLQGQIHEDMPPACGDVCEAHRGRPP
ncbi:MAG: hypothetical protein ACRDSZ_08450 [Pseudonocardiaceae bacterium]